MQPIKPPNSSVGKTIHINPNFAKINSNSTLLKPAAPHINPLFIKAHPPPTTKIHMNPDFLARVRQVYATPISHQEMVPNVPAYSAEGGEKLPANIVNNQAEAKIISKSCTRLVRQPVRKEEGAQPLIPAKQLLQAGMMPDLSESQSPLIYVHKRKLVRFSANTEQYQKTNCSASVQTPINTIPPYKKYKLDNSAMKQSKKPSTPMVSVQSPSQSYAKKKHQPFVARYALHRTVAAGNAMEMKENGQPSHKTALHSERWQRMPPKDTSLRLLNINGLLYKCTHNKLQRKNDCEKANITEAQPHTAQPGAKTITVKSIYTKNPNSNQPDSKPGTRRGDKQLLFSDLSNHRHTNPSVYGVTKRFQYVRRQENSYTTSKFSTMDVNSATNTAISAKTTATQKSMSVLGSALYVNGIKYVVDPHGFKLTRIPPSPQTIKRCCAGGSSAKSMTRNESATVAQQRMRTRLDIGGLTYIAGHNKNENVLMRTRDHYTREHVKQARNRSMIMLRLVKTNVPCAIYQRVGKCAAYERGKCVKKHDKNQVSICPRFLRGECRDSKCLRSHSVSLAKMPVCKFFLQGVCMRTDCPYLHKKLSVKTEVCTDFSRGYCKLADKCSKRHEFICPVLTRTGECTNTDCTYCHVRRQASEVHPKVKVRPERIKEKTFSGYSRDALPSMSRNVASEDLSASHALRYFEKKTAAAAATDDDIGTAFPKLVECEAAVEPTLATPIAKRSNLGALPAYIPLSK